VPHLWSLLTELAGPQGLYCDRIAQVVLSILLGASLSESFLFFCLPSSHFAIYGTLLLVNRAYADVDQMLDECRR
jgi:hypothetical protein